jgi:hypothetical protein
MPSPGVFVFLARLAGAARRSAVLAGFESAALNSQLSTINSSFNSSQLSTFFRSINHQPSTINQFAALAKAHAHNRNLNRSGSLPPFLCVFA